MKTKQITMSVVLAGLISLSATGCGGGSGDSVAGALSSAVDVTVERGKVYDANVTDSSTPAQVATQKVSKNIYTFANEPVYPVLVNGGWIDVNDDGTMDVNDTVLDIEMKSYSTTVTPITTFTADANETIRTQKLEDLLARLNANGVGEDANLTLEDLLKVPSEAPKDVFVIANAIYKDMKENADALPDEDAVLSQFGTLYSALPLDAIAKDFEVLVVGDLVTAGNTKKVSNQDIFEFEQALPDAVVPELALFLLKNNIDGIDVHGSLTFNANYTVLSVLGTRTWSVNGTILILNGADGDREEVVFESTMPRDGSSITRTGYYGDSVQDGGSYQITVTAPVIDTGTGTGADVDGGSPDGSTSLDLTSYSSIIIYKNIDPVS
ncbi:hypothetical protein MNB_SM-4-1252 [hydrothermal vent metagenome]|uniref:Uncharacterized protein n=1 Tax=hydrothermal vent metagenome TaxID=652676 RepID=A0A1W1CM88_9ZZZZ